MPATVKVSYAFTPETIEHLNALAKAWGGVDPMAKSRVIAESLRRHYELATRDAKMREKKS